MTNLRTLAALLALVTGLVAGAYGIKSTEMPRPAQPERASDGLIKAAS